MVVGPVGSGKSSYIQAILGEMPKTSGEITISGTVAYVSQEAFIVNTTVRENIIFGKPFDMDKYKKVLETSALMPDLHQFTAGDRTEIGERGVNLSGGQKQVSLANFFKSYDLSFNETFSVFPLPGRYIQTPILFYWTIHCLPSTPTSENIFSRRRSRSFGKTSSLFSLQISCSTCRTRTKSFF